MLEAGITEKKDDPKGTASPAVHGLKEVLPTIPTVVQELTRESARSLAGPCPKCGGCDRFYYREDLERFACRQCHPQKGDIIDFHCWVMNTNFKSLCEQYLSQTTVDRDEPVIRYLMSRRISHSTICRALELGQIWTQHYKGEISAACLYTDIDGNPGEKRTVQYIPVSGGQKMFKKGSRPGEDFFVAGNRNAKIAVVTEAVINALSVADVMPGYAAVALGSASTIRKASRLKGRDVICFFDNDRAGEKAAAGLGELLPGCRTVRWTDRDSAGCDPNDLLKAGESRRIREMIERADPVISSGSHSRFSFVRVSSLVMRPPEWLVKNLVELDSVAQIFGDPGCGKSFIGIDMACSVAAGIDFHGYPVKQGAVLYVAGEGYNGIMRRLKAYEVHHKIDLKRCPLFISTAPADFCDVESTVEVQRAIETTGERPLLVVVDTLARNFGPGDENSTQDMSRFISSIDQIRSKYRCTMLLIHHTGHGDKNRGRGAMALKGALDAEYRMHKDVAGIVRLENTKMKDFEQPDPLAFKIHSVKLGIADEDGEEITSATLKRIEYEMPVKNASRGKWQAVAKSQLERLYQQHRANLEKGGYNSEQAKVQISDWRQVCFEAGMPRNRFYEVKQKFSTDGDYVYLS